MSLLGDSVFFLFCTIEYITLIVNINPFAYGEFESGEEWKCFSAGMIGTYLAPVDGSVMLMCATCH